MVLAGSFEFWKRFNATIIERETDDVEIPRAMKELRNLGENKKESPFCHPWSIKARTLIHAHFSRVDLHSSRLETGTLVVSLLNL
jgi:translocation protein SEC63